MFIVKAEADRSPAARRQSASAAFALVVSTVVCVSTWSASAAASICRQLSAELASLGNGRNTAAYAAAARRDRAEAAQVKAQLAAAGCDRAWIAGGACTALRGRLAQLNANIGSYQAAADGGAGLAARRRDLMALQAQSGCTGPGPGFAPSRASAPAAPQPREPELREPRSPRPAPRFENRPLTAGLFDDPSADAREERRRRGVVETDPDDEPSEPSLRMGGDRRPGGRIVCVRLCDGFFFPAAQQDHEGRLNAAAQCARMCPAAETVPFYTRGEDVARAVSADGQLYTRIPNAFRFRRSFDPSCGCRRPGQSWGEALADNPHAVPRVEGGGFDVLNPDPFDHDPGLRRPGPSMSEAPIRDAAKGLARAARPPAVPAARAPLPALPQPLTHADRIVGTGDGERREMQGPGGVRRSVRVVAPELLPAPSAEAGPPVPVPPRGR